MKKKLLILTFSITIITVFIGSIYNDAFTTSTGAPSARTGSPGDGGNTCAISGCHTGLSVTTKANIISSDIPTDGYTPGAKYIITATSHSSSNRNTFGFQISPQTNTGLLVGALANINTTQTQIIGGGKYITHKLAGINGISGQKSWTFNWTAPVAGTGAVTFYGCFNNANGNGGSTGDSIIKSTYVVQEKVISGINKDALAQLGISVFPNPAQEHLYIKNDKSINFDRIEILDLTGKAVYNSKETMDFDLQLESLGLTKGIYFVKLYNGNELLGATKFIKQ